MAKVKRICKGFSRRTGLPCKNQAVLVPAIRE